jgi:hypothetical protein
MIGRHAPGSLGGRRYSDRVQSSISIAPSFLVLHASNQVTYKKNVSSICLSTLIFHIASIDVSSKLKEMWDGSPSTAYTTPYALWSALSIPTRTTTDLKVSTTQGPNPTYGFSMSSPYSHSVQVSLNTDVSGTNCYWQTQCSAGS